MGYTSYFFNNRVSSKDDEYEDGAYFTTSFLRSKNLIQDYADYDSDEFKIGYNNFLNDLYNTNVNYYDKLNKKKADENNKQKQIDYYYENNKEELKKKRSNDLIYNWDLSNGNAYYDYGDTPVQDKNGYSKRVDDKGNIYWYDEENKKLYDSNYKEVDISLFDKSKYEFAENSSKYRATNSFDKSGLIAISEDRYKFLLDKEKQLVEKNKQDKQNYINNQNKGIIKSSDYNSDKAPNITPEKDTIYKDLFEKLNRELEKGNYTAANNALQEINKKYFGYDYEDGWFAATFNTDANDRKNLKQRFDSNLDKLNIINNAIKNTNDANTLNELNEEKNKLELENTLIQYNRLCSIYSDTNLVNKLDNIMLPTQEAASKAVDLWSNTFSNFDDGYQFGDVFNTFLNVVNNTFQTIGVVGENTNAGIRAMEELLISDMDESKFKDTWMPAIIDVGTYLIPYVGHARMIINYMEPGSVVGAFITGRESVTIDSENGEARKPDFKNFIGATINIAANFASDLIFSDIRGLFSKEASKKVAEKTAKSIWRVIAESAIGEGGEEFIQTYAEYMQNMEGPMTWSFWKEHFEEACESALIAATTSGGAAAVGGAVNSIRNKTNGQVGVENIRINKDIKEPSNKTIYATSDTKNYNNIINNDIKTETVKVEEDSDTVLNVAQELENGQIVTFLDSDAIKTSIDQTVDLNNISIDNKLSDAIINDNTKYILVPSSEMENYLKNLNNNLVVYTVDPKSDTFMDDVRNFVTEVNKSNIVTKNVNDFIPNDYKFTPEEMTGINKMVNDSINKGILLDNINNPDKTPQKSVSLTVSDIVDSDVNTLMNNIKNKFLEMINTEKISTTSAQKEFKSLNEKLSDYVIKTKQDRTYIKDSGNNIITFVKRNSNLYEATNTIPTRYANLENYANVKTNGNIINGNLNQKVKFTKSQMNAVNNLIDKLKLNGKFITPESTYKDVASLVKSNKDFSKEILQALGADGLIEGINKVKLYTAYDNLDNANTEQVVKHTIDELKSQSFNNEIKQEVLTIAPETVNTKVKESKVSVNEKPIDIEKYASDPKNPSELNNIELEKLFEDSMNEFQITNKVSKTSISEIKDLIINNVVDGYSHIAKIANTNKDYNVKKAIYDLMAVANDANIMINGAQMKNGEVIGKPFNKIYSDNNIKTKKDKTNFEYVILHTLNSDRERAGVEKIFPNISAKQSDAIVVKELAKHSNYKGALEDLRRFSNNLLDMLVDSGVISKQLSTTLENRYRYYMPIYSNDLATFKDLGSKEYFKTLNLDNSIKDVTKTSKHILSLEESMKNKVYNVLSAVAKNKLAQELNNSGNYKGDSDLLYYNNGELTKTKVSKEIIADISNNKASHIADIIHDIPILKQIIDLSNMSYKFILDPIFQIKNVTVDFTDSVLIHSRDKAHFVPNYNKAVFAVANNSEAFNEVLTLGLGKIGEGWNAPKVSYDSNGNVITKQNKFQRMYANLEAMPKIAEYFSLKDKYMAQAKKDFDDGKYTIVDNHLKFNGDEEYAINKWSGSDSYIINQHYRDGSQMDDRLRNVSDNMDSVLNKIKSESGTFNRSIMIEGEKLQNFINKYQKGKIVKEDAFTSMSKDIVYDDSFNIQMEIKSNNAKDVSQLMRKDEVEFLLKRGSEFRVDDVVIDGDNIQLKLTDVTKDLTTIYKDNISLKDIEEQVKIRAMLDASDINLNFNRGGKVTKALSKSGFKFLNAGIQGLDKFVTHVGEKVKTPKGVGSLALEVVAIGASTAIINSIINGDDEDYENLPYYYKNNYYMFKIGDDQFIRIPKGRVQALYNVLFEYSTGIREEDTTQDYVESLASAFENAVLPPSLENASPISAWAQIYENKDAFGNEIYSNKYDTTNEKIQKSVYHLLSNYFGRYGRIVKDVTDGDSTTDLFNEFDFYKDTTKVDKHYSTALKLVEHYQNSDNVKTLDDKAMKKYIDTQNYALRSINSEINQGKKSGLSTNDLKMKYAARDDLLLSMINNYKNFYKEVDSDGNTWYYFDDLVFMYNAKTNKFVKK